MNLNFQTHILSLYYAVPNGQKYSFFFKIINRTLEWFFKKILDISTLEKRTDDLEASLNVEPFTEGANPMIVASLTSFPGRILTAHISILFILNQTVKPNVILLWLAKEQFPNGEKDLPTQLLNLKKRGLQIRFCEDLRSHKKYYYSLKEYSNSQVIMFDDDLYYPNNIIENLLNLSKKHPGLVVASRVHRMRFNGASLAPYRNWCHNYNGTDPSHLNLHTSGNGTLIPPDIRLDSTFFDTKIILDLSKGSDDVWWKANLIRSGIMVVTNNVINKDPITVANSFENSLVSQNTFKGNKDKMIEAVFTRMRISLELLKDMNS